MRRDMVRSQAAVAERVAIEVATGTDDASHTVRIRERERRRDVPAHGMGHERDGAGDAEEGQDGVDVFRVARDGVCSCGLGL